MEANSLLLMCLRILTVADLFDSASTHVHCILLVPYMRLKFRVFWLVMTVGWCIQLMRY